MTRPRSTTQHPPVAECQGCAWQDDARGALGRAAQHHDRTGHVVRIETTTVITYGDPDSAARAAGQLAMTGALE